MGRRNRNIENTVNKNPEPKRTRRRKLTDDEIQAQIDKSINIVNEYRKINEEIRKLRIGKKPKEYKEEVEEINRKEVINFRIKLSVFLVFFIIIGCIFANYYNILGLNLNKNSDVENSSKIDVITTINDLHFSYGNELLFYNNQNIYTYNKSGKISWQYALPEKFNPNIYIKDKYLVVSNNLMGTIYAFYDKKELYNKKIDGQIENVFIDTKGNVAVEYSTSGYKKIVGVYNKKGELLYNTYLASDAILGIELLNDANKMLIITANTSSFKVGINISSIDVNLENASPVVIASLENNFVYDYYVKNNNLILLLDNSIVSLNLSNNEVSKIKEFDSNQMLYISLNNNYYSYVERKVSLDGQYVQENSKLNSKIIGTANVESSPKMFKNIGSVNYLVYQNEIKVYNKWGINIKNISISYPPKEIVPFRNGKSIALVYTNKIYIVNL